MSDQPLFRFVHASDPHWGTHTDPKWLAAPRRCECFVNDLQQIAPPPRFVAITGDLSGRGETEADELAIALDQTARLGLPAYVVPGNHDLTPLAGEGDLPPIAETNWFRRTGEDGLFWVRHEPPLELIGFAQRNGDPDGILDRLEQHLAQPAQGLRVLLMHHPIYPVRTGGLLATWGPDQIADSLDRLWRLLAQHADTVVACLFGHIHVLCARVVRGVLHASGGAVSVGAPGYRIYSVYPDRLVSRFVPLSDPALAEFAFWSENATDAEHPTPESYHRGLPVEQDFCFDFGTRTMLPLSQA